MTEVTTFPVLFTANGTPLAGRVHRRGDDRTERQPAVLVTGSWLTVKEQMADGYAAALARRGYTAITFDFSGFGRSGGDLRHAELPARKITDIVAAAGWASTLSYVDADRIGQLAVCASAQYALAAIARGAAISSFVSVAGWYHDTASVAPFYGGADGVAVRLGRARAALDRYLRTGEPTLVPAYAAGDDRAGMSLPMDYYANPDRGAVAGWPNLMDELTWEHWLTFDGMAAAGRVAVPTLFVHSEKAVLPANVRVVHSRLAGPAELIWADGEQTDFYDRAEQVDLAVDAAAGHFATTLGAS